MTTNIDEQGTGHLERPVSGPSARRARTPHEPALPERGRRAVTEALAAWSGALATPLRTVSGHRRRTTVERLRRSTVWMLITGPLLVWLGVLASFAEGGRAAPPLVVLPGLLGLALFSVLLTRMVRAAVAGTPARREMTASGAIALALLMTQDGYLWSWGLVAPAWASGAALLLSRTGAVTASVGAVGVALLLGGAEADSGSALARPLLSAYGHQAPAAIGIYLGAGLLLPLANRFQLWFWQVVKAAEEGKEARARLAVTEERLRFSRDLHDLVGHSLSAIAVKSEVAVKLSRADTRRATAEMEEVRALAREALKEIRAAVRGYRTVDLDAELRSMVAVLEAGGVRCVLVTPPEPLTEELGALLAWLVREGTTNVLRHSSATRCRIAIGLRDDAAVLEMTNDGATGRTGGGGTGLLGLSERVAATGGVLTAGAAGPGEFRMRATIPLEGVR
ncbi:sensor histidine kinase [Streptosporangium sandarakinum]|uniref:sensor histidine kinase n=1 Tax=Streptosporangium sandarakinum TaxID=1260955 RepID=UPI0033A34FF9